MKKSAILLILLVIVMPISYAYEEKIYIYGNGLIASKESSNNNLVYYHQDFLGSNRFTANMHGELIGKSVQEPYGNDFSDKGTREGLNNDYKFTGQEQDAGLYYYGARYYEPSSGRFISIDPVFDSSVSPYAYVNNNPLKYVDPSGRERTALAMRAYASSEPEGSNAIGRYFLYNVGQLENLGYTTISHCVGDTNAVFSAIKSGKWDLIYLSAHGIKGESIILSNENGMTESVRIEDLNSVDMSSYLNPGGRIILQSCSVATCIREDNIAKAFSRAFDGAEVEGYTVVARGPGVGQLRIKDDGSIHLDEGMASVNDIEYVDGLVFDTRRGAYVGYYGYQYDIIYVYGDRVFPDSVTVIDDIWKEYHGLQGETVRLPVTNNRALLGKVKIPIVITVSDTR